MLTPDSFTKWCGTWNRSAVPGLAFLKSFLLVESRFSASSRRNFTDADWGDSRLMDVSLSRFLAGMYCILLLALNLKMKSRTWGVRTASSHLWKFQLFGEILKWIIPWFLCCDPLGHVRQWEPQSADWSVVFPIWMDEALNLPANRVNNNGYWISWKDLRSCF